MKLEDEIKQTKKFASEQQKLLVNIIYTNNWLRLKHMKSLKPYGISAEQYNVLRILRGQHPNCASNQMIMERMLDKSSNCSRIVDKLKDKKLVDRKENKSDRRQVDIVITEKGLAMLKEIDENEFADLDKYLKNISSKDAAIVNEILDRLRD
ncbi:MAG: MarR family winged helix-turn-helix transcriptional regulator [Cytophagaceae bacterium]